jgi:hypothetical protein
MISLDTDASENADLLRRYVEQQGFPWRFALAPRDVLRELGDVFGTQFLTQPSEPMFLLDPRGATHLLPFGHKSAAELGQAVQRYR